LSDTRTPVSGTKPNPISVACKMVGKIGVFAPIFHTKNDTWGFEAISLDSFYNPTDTRIRLFNKDMVHGTYFMNVPSREYNKILLLVSSSSLCSNDRRAHSN
jgi:hypothetical protein